MSFDVPPVPASNLEAERAVIGACMLDVEAILTLKIECEFEVKWLYSKKHRIILSTIYKLFDEQIECDLLTISTDIKKQGLIDQIAIDKVGHNAGDRYLSTIMDSVDTTSNVKFHAEILEYKYHAREFAKICYQFPVLASKGEDLTELYKKAADIAFKSANMGGKDSGAFHIKDLMVSIPAEIQAVMDSGGVIDRTDLGMAALDFVKIRRGQVCLIGARPSMGKTSFVNGITLAESRKRDVFYFSIEESKESLKYALLSYLTGIEADTIEEGIALTDGDWKLVSDAITHVSNCNLTINDDPGMSCQMAISIIKRACVDPALIIFDHVHEMQPDIQGQNQEANLSSIATGLRAVAKEFTNSRVIALSQLSRAPETRLDHRPVPSDLRHSGALEQVADQIIMLYRPSKYDIKDTSPDEIIVSKQRKGKTDIVECAFTPETRKWSEL